MLKALALSIPQPVSSLPRAMCWICSKPIISRGAGRPTCSACRQKYGSGACLKCASPKRTAKPGLCWRCLGRQSSGGRGAPGVPAALLVTFTCANGNCGREFTRRLSQTANDHPCCSHSCSSKEAIRRGLMPQAVSKTGADRATTRTAKARARRLRHAETWDGIGDEEILGRDGWRCQIQKCLYRSRKIDRERRFPDPRSKAIDHIVPLSLGGDDTSANKRAAHHGCNMARGNRMGDEQVALFGAIREPPLATATAGERAVMLQRRKRLCACGAVPLDSRKFCQECLDRSRVLAEERAALKQSCRIQIYACRYCGELKVAKASSQPREVCPARPCQLARRAANNLRVRNGVTTEDANAYVAAIMLRSADAPVGERWRWAS